MKSLFRSKTFWVNALSIAANYIGVIPIDPQTFVYVAGAVNIALRIITKGVVYVIKDASEEP